MTNCNFPGWAAKHPDICHPTTTTTVPPTTVPVTTVPPTTVALTTVPVTTTARPFVPQISTQVVVRPKDSTQRLPDTGGNETLGAVAFLVIVVGATLCITEWFSRKFGRAQD